MGVCVNVASGGFKLIITNVASWVLCKFSYLDTLKHSVSRLIVALYMGIMIIIILSGLSIVSEAVSN